MNEGIAIIHLFVKLQHAQQFYSEGDAQLMEFLVDGEVLVQVLPCQDVQEASVNQLLLKDPDQLRKTKAGYPVLTNPAMTHPRRMAELTAAKQ